MENAALRKGLELPAGVDVVLGVGMWCGQFKGAHDFFISTLLFESSGDINIS
jgi:hypothetical protein